MEKSFLILLFSSATVTLNAAQQTDHFLDPQSEVQAWEEPAFCQKLLFKAIRHNDKEEILDALRSGAAINAFEPGTGKTPLEIALDKGKYAAIRVLLEQGADPRCAGKNRSNYSILIKNNRSHFIPFFAQKNVPYTNTSDQEEIATLKKKDLKRLITRGCSSAARSMFQHKLVEQHDITPELYRLALTSLTTNSLRHFFKKIQKRSSESSQKELRDEDSEKSCPICLVPIATHEQKRKTICSHEFHRTCIDRWVSSTNTCPLCRTEKPFRKKKVKKLTVQALEAITTAPIL